MMMMMNISLFILIYIVIHFNEHNSYAVNCTGSCIENFRRKWPKLDFEFYYENGSYFPNIYGNNYNNNNSIIIDNKQLPELQITNEELFTSPAPTHTSSFQVSLNDSANFSLSAATLSNCTDEKNLINSSNINFMSELHLLKTSFRNQRSLFNITNGKNTTEYFRNRLKQIYHYGLNQQNEFPVSSDNNDSLDLNVLGVVLDNSKETIEVIYNLRDNGTLVPYEKASKLMSWAPSDLIQNLTGFPIISKVEPYVTRSASESNLAQSNWINLASLLMLLALLLLLFFLLILCCYCIFKRERENWIEGMNREISRVIPNGSEQDVDDGHWNSAASSADDLSSSYNVRNVKKIDKSSQYDYSSFHAPIRTWSTFTTKTPTQNRERLIPIKSISLNDSDYDKISYIHSLETIKETHKHPNILEIKLREETQSIVKEIRKELDRYNQRKILNDDTSSTSEA